MNKGARVLFVGYNNSDICCNTKVQLNGFEVGRVYRIKAGRGDADCARSDGLLGALIESETLMVITDDFGNNRRVSFNRDYWLLVEDKPNTNPVRKPVNIYIPPAIKSSVPSFRI